MIDVKKTFEYGLRFHGHKCPAMPLGIRAAAAAMERLGVSHSKDKELYCISETGKGHAAGCFLDGIMVATGCTYGKSNIEKKYHNKMAFTLIDTIKNRAVRVSLKPDFFEKTVNSPFVQERKKGVLPQDITSEITDPLIEKILSIPEESFLDISDQFDFKFEKTKGEFNIKRCTECGESVFIDKLDKAGKCVPCSQK